MVKCGRLGVSRDGWPFGEYSPRAGPGSGEFHRRLSQRGGWQQHAVARFQRDAGPLQGLSVSGFISNTTGMWVQSNNIRYNRSKNSLATERNWLQLDINYILNGNNRFFVRGWGVYEPPYPFEYKAGLTGMEDYYNQYNVRDAYWKNTTGPLTLFVGRQIVTWGESLAFRVGDVINPQDFTWNFGFANLEQSRMPLWMVHPIYKFPISGRSLPTSSKEFGRPLGSRSTIRRLTCRTRIPRIRTATGMTGSTTSPDRFRLISPFTLVSSGRFETQPAPISFGTPGVPANMTAFPQLCGQIVGRTLRSGRQLCVAVTLAIVCRAIS